MQKTARRLLKTLAEYRTMRNIILALVLILSVSACDMSSFMPDAQGKFADQGYKTSIALIQLHYVRTGAYPSTLNDIKFTGDWDPIYQQFVEYKKIGEGYQLNIRDKEMAKELSYPKEFWSGLGLLSTNVQGFPANKSLNSTPKNGAN